MKSAKKPKIKIKNCVILIKNTPLWCVLFQSSKTVIIWMSGTEGAYANPERTDVRDGRAPAKLTQPIAK